MPERYTGSLMPSTGWKINPKNIDATSDGSWAGGEGGDVIAQKSGLICRLFRASRQGWHGCGHPGRQDYWPWAKEAASAGNFPGAVVGKHSGTARWWRWKLAAAGRVGQRAEQLGELTRLEPTGPARPVKNRPLRKRLQGKIAALPHVADRAAFTALLARKRRLVWAQ